MTIQERIKRLRAINIDRLLDKILKKNRVKILDMNRSQMWDKGIVDVKDPGRKEKYSPATIRAKKRSPFNKTEFVTLKDKGKFHRDLKLEISKEEILIKSDTPYWKYHERGERFGNALGLTEDNISKLRELVKEEILEKIKDVI